MGVAFDIVEVVINGIASGGWGTEIPTTFSLQWSDDGVTFTDQDGGSFTAAPWPLDGGVQTFSLTPYVAPEAGKHRYWRINCNSNDFGSHFALAEVAMAITAGGSNIVGTGIASAWSHDSHPSGSNTDVAALAADGSPSTDWDAAGPLPAWWQYDFGWNTYYAVAEVTIWPWSAYPSTAPKAWDLQYSDDGVTFTTLQSFTSAPWVSSTPQTFEVTGTVPPATASPGFAMILA